MTSLSPREEARAFWGPAAGGQVCVVGAERQLRAEPPPRRTGGEGTEPPCVKAEAGTDLQPPRGADAGLGSPVAGPTGALALYYTPETGNPQTE